ncbi:hypothetical protein [Paenibacillus flagellatus]|uniref:Uncharacterized protein n=1 Tax=Paenibacillus flagellatus TaxID=2211139 RepID=A0A2V5JX39_9BACL|nr:hypothetical protein [Paenibacillus flagellatus]PYI51415.1 hypothetical protein DLM86_25715 [Paenibacillus flagellatus]
MSNKYNNNKHDASPKDNQTPATNEHGELRSGRLSMIKNHNPTKEAPENEYLDSMTNDRGDH